MKKAFMLTPLFLLLLASCSDSKKGGSSNDDFGKGDTFVEEDAVSEEEIISEVTIDRSAIMKEQIQNIYDEIIPQYLANNAPDRVRLMQNYWSEELLELDRKATKLANATNDELGPIDFDEWIRAQDWDNTLSANIVKGQLTSNETGAVIVEITNCGKTYYIRFMMKFEHNEWKIDDIQYKDRGYWEGIRKFYENYLSN